MSTAFSGGTNRRADQLSHRALDQVIDRDETACATAVAYVQFALRRPALFRAMFTEQCDAGSPERVEAVAAISTYLRANIARVFPDADADALSDAVWALVHGLAFLFLDGKFDSADTAELDRRVRAAIQAVLSLPGS